MPYPKELNISFQYLGDDYNISLVRSEKSDHSVEMNGFSYVVLGDKDKLDKACEILKSVSLDSISSSEDLKDRLSLRNDISFPPRAQKIDNVGAKTLGINSVAPIEASQKAEIQKKPDENDLRVHQDRINTIKDNLIRAKDAAQKLFSVIVDKVQKISKGKSFPNGWPNLEQAMKKMVESIDIARSQVVHGEFVLAEQSCTEVWEEFQKVYEELSHCFDEQVFAEEILSELFIEKKTVLRDSLVMAKGACRDCDCYLMEKQVDDYLLGAEKHWGFSGSVATVYGGNKLQIHAGYGKINPMTPKTSKTNTENTVFSLGSVTKFITAIAIMRLQEDKPEFDIDKPITSFLSKENLPNNPEIRVSWDKITVRHLLTHRSGLPNHMKGLNKKFQELKKHKNGRVLTSDEIINLVKEDPLTQNPGNDPPEYNNTAYILLGKIIENVSGKKYGDYLEQAIFDIAGMKNSGLNGSASAKENVNIAEGWKPDNTGESLEAFSSGGVYSTTNDLIRLEGALHSGKILSMQSLSELEKGVHPQAMITEGFGCDISRELGFKVITKGGGLPGFTTCITLIPEKENFIAVLGNSLLRSEKVTYDLSRILLDIQVNFPKALLDELVIKDYVGHFEEKDRTGWPSFSLEEINGMLCERYPDESYIQLIHQGKDVFIQPDSGNEIRFVRDKNQKVIGCHVVAGTYPANAEFQIRES